VLALPTGLLAIGAGPALPVADPDLTVLADGRDVRSNYQPPGMTDRYGRAKVLVHAPIGLVHRLVLDYGHYKEFTGGKFHTSRVIGRTPLGTEVYFQISVLGGMIMLWQVFRFQDLKPLAPGWAIVEGWYVKGNIGRGNAAWTLQAIDDEQTLLTFDLLVIPNMQLPQSMLDEGLRNAAGAAVEAIRRRAQEVEEEAPQGATRPAPEEATPR
jgi:hypothetical protein